ncbi:MAG: ATP-dependent helicase HrpB [Verrucomicrobiales bacterium]|nr:ATP-dependent helicase HrpB [Verrucomicrobiales bacterium]|tara:strand:+ start:8558 stop:11128 length:2571 start_codon:yes stop_codon:yes gene_type:complete
MDKRLPIYEIEESIIAELKATKRLVLSAPTGSGKSTQVPRMLLKHGLLDEPTNGQVVILQPRRIAARMLATRVADESRTKLGDEVGYQIRFENRSSSKTRIKFLTEGILLRQMIKDPELKGISAILFDEFHERHLYGDITLARALDIQESTRPDLQLMVMSATIDSDLIAAYLGTREGKCRVVNSDGRTFPVDIEYARKPSYENRAPIWEQAADAFSEFTRRNDPGDTLIFMPGAFEIHKTIETLRHRKEARGHEILPLHGELNTKDQDAAVNRYSKPKIVVATNVAETSLTIDGIRLVIDSGLARIPRYDPYRGINTLLIEKISQASADQRTGRAGRTASGICLRLWSEREHQDRHAQEKPEVQRVDLSEVILTLKSAGIEDINSFHWLEHPGDKRLSEAEELLLDLGALERIDFTRTRMTEIGKRMLAFPLHPRYARMLLAAEEHKCVHEACLAAALTQGRDVLIRKVDKRVKDKREDFFGRKAQSDLFVLMKAWSHAAENRFSLEACQKLGIHAQSARQVGPLFQQFLDIANREGLSLHEEPAQEIALQKSIIIGFSDRIARRADSGTLRCEMVRGRKGVLARESRVHHAELIAVSEVSEIGQSDGDVNTIFSLATAIKPAWLEELFPNDFDKKIETWFDTKARRVYAHEARFFRDIRLGKKMVEPPPLEQSAVLLADEVSAGRLELKDWDHSVEQWIARVNNLAKWCPEFELPPITDEDRRTLVEQICHGEFSYRSIKDKPVKGMVKEWLSDLQKTMLNDHAPERINLTNGRTPKVKYTEGEPPLISLRVQELYDVNETPTVAMGRQPVLVHILAPNMRPVQVTQDLKNFWKEGYPAVKSQLAGRYPKHEWR